MKLVLGNITKEKLLQLNHACTKLGEYKNDKDLIHIIWSSHNKLNILYFPWYIYTLVYAHLLICPKTDRVNYFYHYKAKCYQWNPSLCQKCQILQVIIYLAVR